VGLGAFCEENFSPRRQGNRQARQGNTGTKARSASALASLAGAWREARGVLRGKFLAKAPREPPSAPREHRNKSTKRLRLGVLGGSLAWGSGRSARKISRQGAKGTAKRAKGTQEQEHEAPPAHPPCVLGVLGVLLGALARNSSCPSAPPQRKTPAEAGGPRRSEERSPTTGSRSCSCSGSTCSSRCRSGPRRQRRCSSRRSSGRSYPAPAAC
jgi:hypothetical protein